MVREYEKHYSFPVARLFKQHHRIPFWKGNYILPTVTVFWLLIFRNIFLSARVYLYLCFPSACQWCRLPWCQSRALSAHCFCRQRRRWWCRASHFSEASSWRQPDGRWGSMSFCRLMQSPSGTSPHPPGKHSYKKSKRLDDSYSSAKLKKKLSQLCLINTHESNKHNVTDLFNVCKNHTKFKLCWTRT